MLSLGFSVPLPSINIKLISNRKQYNFDTKLRKVVATTTSSNNINNAAGEVALPEGLKHVAVIMDGHRRWAKQKGLTIKQGHRAGGEKIQVLARLCSQWGLKVLTVYAFSTENWIRLKEEVDFLMKLFLELIGSQENLDEWARDGRRVSFIGDKSILSKSLQDALTVMEEKKKSNSGLHVMIAINYSGRHDILQATKSIARKINNGLLKVEDIDQNLFEQELETRCAEFPEPDLLIRTSGEQRLSNFMLWQLAYTEFYFVNKLFPDMEEADFIKALMSFQPRQRRYGGSNELQ
ncbi:Dehydrodolichyl diphosphate synthase [Datura stramonium]|uniref:Alkyl transferase n=1 Tax=Datura stramonium TaxID=4076 RepID=A0ABS8VAE2_DATST|nr:Dehydrodolichyl diphosphate synthase [Datura stramonium]